MSEPKRKKLNSPSGSAPRRKVIGTEAANHYIGSWILDLECGHIREIVGRVPATTQCYECLKEQNA